MGLGFALGKVDQDVRHFLVLGLEVDAGNDVSAVFLVGQRLRLRVRGLFGQGVDGGTARITATHSIGMDGDEEVSLVIACHLHALAQREETVVGAGHNNVNRARSLKEALELETEGKDYVLLPRLLDADCTGIDAAVAGINDNQLAVTGGCGRGLAVIGRVVLRL